jgi:hypothetical protein
MGTADAGHYYSLISDREHNDDKKWFEFNDTQVDEFDVDDLADEAFGGEETNMINM